MKLLILDLAVAVAYSESVTIDTITTYLSTTIPSVREIVTWPLWKSIYPNQPEHDGEMRGCQRIGWPTAVHIEAGWGAEDTHTHRERRRHTHTEDTQTEKSHTYTEIVVLWINKPIHDPQTIPIIIKLFLYTSVFNLESPDPQALERILCALLQYVTGALPILDSILVPRVGKGYAWRYFCNPLV